MNIRLSGGSRAARNRQDLTAAMTMARLPSTMRAFVACWGDFSCVVRRVLQQRRTHPLLLPVIRHPHDFRVF